MKFESVFGKGTLVSGGAKRAKISRSETNYPPADPVILSNNLLSLLINGHGATPPMKPTCLKLILSFLLLTAVTIPVAGFMNYSFVLPLWRQIQARSYATTTGVVQQANIRWRDTSESTVTTLILNYDYEVDGVGYESQRYRYARDSSYTYLRDVVEELRRERMVTVMYDPDDPAEAILNNKFSLHNTFHGVVFGMGVNGLALMFWSAWWAHLWLYLARESVAGRIVRRKDDRVHQRITLRLSASMSSITLGAGCGCLSIMMFIGIGFSTIVLPQKAAHWLGLVGLGVVFVLTVYKAVKTEWDMRRGYLDLVIDSRKKALLLPRTLSGATGVSIPFDQLTRISSGPTSGAEKRIFTPQLAITLHYRDDQSESHTCQLAYFNQTGKAVEVAEWLRTELLRFDVTVETEKISNKEGDDSSVQLDPAQDPPQ